MLAVHVISVPVEPESGNRPDDFPDNPSNPLTMRASTRVVWDWRDAKFRARCEINVHVTDRGRELGVDLVRRAASWHAIILTERVPEEIIRYASTDAVKTAIMRGIYFPVISDIRPSGDGNDWGVYGFSLQMPSTENEAHELQFRLHAFLDPDDPVIRDPMLFNEPFPVAEGWENPENAAFHVVNNVFVRVPARKDLLS